METPTEFPLLLNKQSLEFRSQAAVLQSSFLLLLPESKLLASTSIRPSAPPVDSMGFTIEEVVSTTKGCENFLQKRCIKRLCELLKDFSKTQHNKEIISTMTLDRSESTGPVDKLQKKLEEFRRIRQEEHEVLKAATQKINKEGRQGGHKLSTFDQMVLKLLKTDPPAPPALQLHLVPIWDEAILDILMAYGGQWDIERKAVLSEQLNAFRDYGHSTRLGDLDHWGADLSARDRKTDNFGDDMFQLFTRSGYDFAEFVGKLKQEAGFDVARIAILTSALICEGAHIARKQFDVEAEPERHAGNETSNADDKEPRARLQRGYEIMWRRSDWYLFLRGIESLSRIFKFWRFVLWFALRNPETETKLALEDEALNGLISRMVNEVENRNERRGEPAAVNQKEVEEIFSKVRDDIQRDYGLFYLLQEARDKIFCLLDEADPGKREDLCLYVFNINYQHTTLLTTGCTAEDAFYHICCCFDIDVNRFNKNDCYLENGPPMIWRYGCPRTPSSAPYVGREPFGLLISYSAPASDCKR